VVWLLAMATISAAPSGLVEFAHADPFRPVDICPNPETALSGKIELENGPRRGAQYVVCVPEDWIGDLAVYAHGTVRPEARPGKIEAIVPQLATETVSLPGIANDLGFAFAVLARSQTGLSQIDLAQQELIALVEEIATKLPDPPAIVYLIGASQGGLIITRLLEEEVPRFDGGLSACGPIGSIARQVTYWGDLLVAFDYFFPKFELLVPPSEVDESVVGIVRVEALTQWELGLSDEIADALSDRPGATGQLRDVASVPRDPTGAVPLAETILEVLTEAALTVNAGSARFGGNPFDNRTRRYRGSNNDDRLNLEVKRYRSVPEALAEIERSYETSGSLRAPLVTLHTIWDQRTPYWHEGLYRRKVVAADARSLHRNVPVLRYGHCNFKAADVIAALGLLVARVEGVGVVADATRLPTPRFQGLGRTSRNR
jgi:hypothetical protein